MTGLAVGLLRYSQYSQRLLQGSNTFQVELALSGSAGAGSIKLSWLEVSADALVGLSPGIVVDEGMLYNVMEEERTEEACASLWSSIDTVPPVIKLNGKVKAQFNQVEQCGTYVDAGARATDNVDGSSSLTQKITTSVEDGSWPLATDTPGRFRIVYNVVDSSGNKAAEKSRYVRVTAKEGAHC